MITNWPNNGVSPYLVFAGGGTGGHMFPALAVASEIRRRFPGAKIVFFGTDRPIDQRILAHTDYKLIQQALPPMTGKPWRWPDLFLSYRRSRASCRSNFERERPHVVVGTGGAGSYPAVKAAALLGIPTALLNPDAIPGRANRHLAGCVGTVFVQWQEAAARFPTSARVIVAGCPIRSAFSMADRGAGFARFDLDPTKNTLLITGASQGARTINESILSILSFLKTHSNWQILHLSGEADFQRARSAYQGAGLTGVVLPFTDHMADALACADLVVSRAGASTLAEITFLGKPAVLMPYPFHKDMHQLANARCLADSPYGAAAQIVMDRIDPRINGPALREALEALMKNGELRATMGRCSQRIGRLDTASRVAVELARIGGFGKGCEAVEFLEESCSRAR